MIISASNLGMNVFVSFSFRSQMGRSWKSCLRRVNRRGSSQGMSRNMFTVDAKKDSAALMTDIGRQEHTIIENLEHPSD